MKALLLQRTSQQGETEIPLELTKLKSESHFWWQFRVSCHARWESLAHIYLRFVALTLWDYLTQGTSHTPRFTLFIVSCLVSTV